MEITVTSQQRAVRVDLGKLEIIARAALPRCLERPARPRAPLSSLEAIEVTLIPDAVIARVHADFMGIPGPTDVITFDHGEILIGAGTAQANARRYGVEIEREIGLYIIHGLLHLGGHTDAAPGEAARMRAVQEEILSAVWQEQSLVSSL